jgi:hypothetical protein
VGVAAGIRVLLSAATSCKCAPSLLEQAQAWNTTPPLDLASPHPRATEQDPMTSQTRIHTAGPLPLKVEELTAEWFTKTQHSSRKQRATCPTPDEDPHQHICEYSYALSELVAASALGSPADRQAESRRMSGPATVRSRRRTRGEAMLKTPTRPAPLGGGVPNVGGGEAS